MGGYDCELVFDRYLGTGGDLNMLQDTLADLAPRWASKLRVWAGPKGSAPHLSDLEDEPMSVTASLPSWVPELCSVAVRLRIEDRSVIDLVWDASPNLSDEAGFRAAVATYLHEHPELPEAWSRYSADKRMSQGPYLRLGTPSQVGYYADGYRDISSYDDPAEACADFLWREIERLRASPYWK